MSATLIFPAVTLDARAYYQQAIARGQAVIAAASVDIDKTDYPNQAFLPNINSPDFAQAFADLVKRFVVSNLYVPVPSAYHFLKQFIAKHSLPLTLLNDSAFDVQAREYRELLLTAENLMRLERSIAGDKSALTLADIAAILRQAMSIHGESNEHKLAAMMGIFALAPQGDIVEVGTLMGRTAAVLKLLANVYRTGSVLTVDPWDSEEAKQYDSPPVILEMAAAWEPGLLAKGFRINMLGLGAGKHAHLPYPSTQAYDVYVSGIPIAGLDDSPVDFNKRISVLHIDANHDFASVSMDWQLWGKHLVPGGWLILDDYVWMHGDGPQRLGDSLLAGDKFQRSFVCGKALFAQRTSDN